MTAQVQQNYNRYKAVTKSNSVNFDGTTYSATASVKAVPCDAIWIGGAGLAVVVAQDGTTTDFTCVAGTLLPVTAIRVNDTNTTATLMVAMYLD